MPDAGEFDTRAELVALLMQKVEEDRYPSSTMLDMLEEMLTPDDVPAYVETLTNRMRSENFPSISMLNRVQKYA